LEAQEEDMAKFIVSMTGWVRGYGADGEKYTVPKRFNGGNGKADSYETKDRNLLAVLRGNRTCQEVPVEEPREAVREEAEAPAVQAEAEEQTAAPTKYTREEVTAGLQKKSYNDLRDSAEAYGVSTRADKGFKKKAVLIEEIADAYIARQDG
jgi:hypothetical protein